MMLNLLLYSLEEPLNRVYIQGSKKLNIFIQMYLYYIVFILCLYSINTIFILYNVFILYRTSADIYRKLLIPR